MDVSRSTVMRLGDTVTDDVLAAIDQYKLDMTPEQSEAVPIPQAGPQPELPPAELIPVTHRSIALSRIAYGAGTPIDTIAQTFGLSVFAYNQAVNDTALHCNQADTSFIQLRM